MSNLEINYGMEQTQLINQQFANQNRTTALQQNFFIVNLVSSPGSGKTSILLKTIQSLKNFVPINLIECDPENTPTNKRLHELNVPILQINTGKTGFLNAQQINKALENLSPEPNSLVFIENIGDLIGHALLDLGESCKVVVVSVTEGDDLPLKYPYIFQSARLLIINKMDLLPYVDFNVEHCIENVHKINPNIKVVQISARNGKGMDTWTHWVMQNQEQQSHVYVSV